MHSRIRIGFKEGNSNIVAKKIFLGEILVFAEIIFRRVFLAPSLFGAEIFFQEEAAGGGRDFLFAKNIFFAENIFSRRDFFSRQEFLILAKIESSAVNLKPVDNITRRVKLTDCQDSFNKL